MRADVPLADLLLDTENPRLDIQEGHRQAVRAHFSGDRAVKTLALLEDINERGMLSPLEKVGASPSSEHPGRYIVKEGNRRVASLIVLHSPDIVKDLLSKSDQQRLAKVAAEFQARNLPAVVEAEILPPDELAHWIHLRHTGENDGVGIVSWGLEEQDRWRIRRGARKPLDLQLLDRYRGNVKGDAAEEQLIREVPKSTLRRLFEVPAVRDALGVSVNDAGAGLTRFDDQQLNKWMKRIVHDLAKKRKTSRQLNTTRQMIEYVESLDELPAPGDALPAPVPLEQTPSTPTPTSTSTARSRKQSTKAWSIRSLQIEPTHARLQEIVKQVKRLAVDTYPDVLAVMLRVLLELSVDEYNKRHKVKVKPSRSGYPPTLHESMLGTIDDMEKKALLDRKEVDAVRKRAKPLTQSLQELVHNQDLHFGPSDVLALWKTFGPFLVAAQK